MSGPGPLDPSTPDPSSEDTLRLPIGVPADPYTTMPLKVADILSIESTQKLKVGVPEPSLDQTQKIAVSEPFSDQTQKMPLPEPSPDQTQKLILSGPRLDQTQKMVVPRFDGPPLRHQKVDVPVEAEGQTQPGLERTEVVQPISWKLPTALGLLVVVSVLAYVALPKRAAPAVTPPLKVPTSLEGVPAEVQLYLAQAKAGDTHAMRMLGAMYLQGLNVPKDREKGIYWYRKAAEQGSDAARIELKQIEGGR